MTMNDGPREALSIVYAAIVHDILWLGFAIASAAYLMLVTTRAVNDLASRVQELTNRVDVFVSRADESVGHIAEDVREIADACRRQE